MKFNCSLSLFSRLIFFCLLSPVSFAAAQEAEVKLSLPPQSPPKSQIAMRLLPAEYELNDGNAVPVLLRMSWEQSAFMADVYPVLDRYANMEMDNPELQKLKYGSFAETMRRAAFMRDANWEYDLQSEQPYMILLPDVQSMRQFVGRGMTGWIKQKLSQDDVETACVGIETQLGCARHVGRTPVLVNQLVSLALAFFALDNVERVIEFEDAPNLYWTLALLPDEIGNIQAGLEFDNHMLIQSLPSLKKFNREIGSDGWKDVAKEFMEVSKAVTPLFADTAYSETEADRMLKKVTEVAQQELASELDFSAAEINAMSGEEKIMRWMLYYHRKMSGQMESAFQLPVRLALPRLLEIQNQVETMTSRTGSKVIPFLANGPAIFVAAKRFDRRVKMLQVIESIRDYAAKNDRKLPNTLEQLELPAPNDPFTDQPFEYKLSGETAELSMAEVEGVPNNTQRKYLFSIKKK